MATKYLLRFIKKNEFNRFLVGSLSLFIILSLVVSSGISLFNYYEDYRVRSAPTEDYFDYQSIEFVEVDGNALVFVSTAQYKASYPVTWNDILRCENLDKSFRFTSVQNTNSDKPTITTDVRKYTWNYNEPFPKGRNCFLDSTITMNVEGVSKQEKITSDVFTVE